MLLALALLLVYAAQCVWFIRTQSFTVDEPEHIVAGLEAWRYGEFKQWVPANAFPQPGAGL